MRFRDIFLGIGSALVLVLLLLSDPQSGIISQLPFGAATLGLILNLVIAIFFVGFLHFSRKALLDYIDLELFFKKAMEQPTGAGLALVAVGLIMISIALVMLAAVK